MYQTFVNNAILSPARNIADKEYSLNVPERSRSEVPLDRIRVTQQMVSIISRSSAFVVGRLEAQKSGMLGGIIVLLIVSEIILALYRKAVM
jgi:hypothetical protein